MGRNHEVTKEQPLLDEKGAFRECGWSKQQVQRYSRRDIKASAFRIKEWDYYLVTGQKFGVAMTLSDDGYVGLQSVSFLKFEPGQEWEHTETILNVFPMGKFHLPENSSEGDTIYEDKRLQMKFHLEKQPDGTIIRHLDCHFSRFYEEKDFNFHIQLKQQPMDTMVINIPWKDKKKAFYFNQKINCMRASGYAMFDGERFEFDPETDFGTLDWGRGVWTYDNVWYWGNGNGVCDGHVFGFNIGYGFGDNSAATENVIHYDGKVHKLDDIEIHIPKDAKGNEEYMKPWKITSSNARFEMDFVPVLDRAAHLNALIIESDQHQVFGKMSGRMELDDGQVIQIRDCLCFVEKVHNRY